MLTLQYVAIVKIPSHSRIIYNGYKNRPTFNCIANLHCCQMVKEAVAMVCRNRLTCKQRYDKTCYVSYNYY